MCRTSGDSIQYWTYIVLDRLYFFLFSYSLHSIVQTFSVLEKYWYQGQALPWSLGGLQDSSSEPARSQETASVSKDGRQFGRIPESAASIATIAKFSTIQRK